MRRSRAEAMVERTAKRAASKAAILVPPWALWLVALLVGALLHHWFNGVGLPFATAGMTIVTLLLTTLTWTVSRSRGDIGRLHAAASTALFGTWLIIATVTGATAHPTIDLWLLGGAGLAAAWNIRSFVRSHSADDGVQRGSIWDELAAKAGLEGVKLKPREVTENRAKGTLQLPPGMTVDEAQKNKGELASVLQVPPNGVRVVPNPDNAAQAELTIVRRDPLRTPVDWRPPQVTDVPVSIAEPLNGGVYEDTEPVLVPLHIPGYGCVHVLIQGMTGSGKSAFALGLIGQAFYRADAFIIGIDVKKAAQTFKDVKHGLDMPPITTEAAAKKFFKRVPKAVDARTEHLGSRGSDKWYPGCGLPMVIVWIEEASGLVADNNEFVRLMETARSVGIVIITSLQRAAYTSIDTGARAMFPTVICFGVADLDDARFALPDEVIEAGADPSIWRTDQPGCAYLVAPGLTQDRKVTPLRSNRIDPNEDQFRIALQEAASYHAAHSSGLDPATAHALGDLCTTQPATATRQPASPVEDDEDEPVADEDDVMRLSFEDPDPSVQPTINDEITSVEDGAVLTFGRTAVRMEPEEARQLLLDRLAELEAAGELTIAPRDFLQVTQACGRSRAWVRKRLDELVDADRLERLDTGYRITPSPDRHVLA